MYTIDEFTKEQAEKIFDHCVSKDPNHYWPAVGDRMLDESTEVFSYLMDQDKYKLLDARFRVGKNNTVWWRHKHLYNNTSDHRFELYYTDQYELTDGVIEFDTMFAKSGPDAIMAATGMDLKEAILTYYTQKEHGKIALILQSYRRSKKFVMEGHDELEVDDEEFEDDLATIWRDELENEGCTSHLLPDDWYPILQGVPMTHLFPTEEAFVTVFKSAAEKIVQHITDFCDDFQAKMQAIEDDVTSFDYWYDDVLCNEITFDPEVYGIELTEEPTDENQPA